MSAGEQIPARAGGAGALAAHALRGARQLQARAGRRARLHARLLRRRRLTTY